MAESDVSNVSANAGNEFTGWLSHYLSERIQLLSWALENWSQRPSKTDQRVIERATFEQTLEKFKRVFSIVADDRRLREQLHWNNGLVGNPEKGDRERIIESRIDWNPAACFTVPRDGVFGFILSEALINAARHGKRGTSIMVRMIHNQTRNEFCLTIENAVANVEANSLMTNSKPYGGVAIINELTRLCGWLEPEYSTDNEIYRLKIVVPAMWRKPESDAD